LNDLSEKIIQRSDAKYIVTFPGSCTDKYWQAYNLKRIVGWSRLPFPFNRFSQYKNISHESKIKLSLKKIKDFSEKHGKTVICVINVPKDYLSYFDVSELAGNTSAIFTTNEESLRVPGTTRIELDEIL